MNPGETLGKQESKASRFSQSIRLMESAVTAMEILRNDLTLVACDAPSVGVGGGPPATTSVAALLTEAPGQIEDLAQRARVACDEIRSALI